MSGVIILNPAAVFLDPNQQAVQSNATITASGSQVLTGYGVTEVSLFINVTVTPTGTTPTLQYTLQEVDPGDGTTLIGSSVSSTVINSIGIQRVTLTSSFGGSIKVSWVIGGTTPSFTGVYTTLVGKSGNVKLVDSTGTVIGPSNPLRVDGTGTTTQPVSGTVTVVQATAASLNATVVGSGTAGTPAGGVLTIQGISGGQPIPISGAISATNPSVGTNAAAIPSSSTQIGGSDGTNLQAASVFDADSGGGTQYVLGTVLRKSASGGSVEAGTATDPLRVDPTGTTTQPVSGTVTANIGTTNGLALAVNQTTLGNQTTKINDGTNTATVKAASTAAVASDTAIVVAISPNNSITASNPSVSATGSAPPAQATSIGGSVTTAAPSYTTGQLNSLSLNTAGGLRVDGSGVTQPVSAASLPLPSGAATETTLAAINTKTLAAGQAVMASSYPVVIASNQTAIPITDNAGSLTVDGTVTANIGTTNGLALDATLTGNNQRTRITDGTTLVAVKAASTAAVAADPALVVAISPNNSVAITAASLPLPAGAATETTLAAINTKTLAAGQAVMAASSPVVIASNQSEVASKNAASSQVDGHSVSIGATTDADTANTVIGRLKQIITKLAGGLPAALIGGRLDSNIGAWLGSTAPTVGQKTGAASIPTVAASDQWPDALARSIFVKRTDGTNVAPTGDVVARSIFQQISDGTTGPVAVKPASTQPVVGDQALVVVLSPNQAAIPTTTSPLNSTPLLSMGDVALSSVTTAAIRRTAYTEQTVNFTGSVSSNNAADSAAGAGMRTARITWMNSTGVTVGTEDVALNGTTPVNLVTTTKCYIDKIEGLTWGANGTNTGIISLFTGAAGAGTLVGTIAATDNRTFWAHHYVQSGKTGNVTSVFHGNNSTVSGGTSVAVLRRKTIVANSGEVQISDFIRISGAVNSLPRNYGSVVQVSGPARIAMYVTTSSATSIVYTGSFDSYDA